jgi:hypothetical protein
MLSILFRRLFDVSLDKNSSVAEIIIEKERVKKIYWRWRRRLFQWEMEMVDVCNGLTLSKKRVGSGRGCWKWREET